MLTQVLPLDGAVLETEWTTVPLPITPANFPSSAVIGNTIQVITYDRDQNKLPKMLVSVKSRLVRGSAGCMKGEPSTWSQTACYSERLLARTSFCVRFVET